jgi:hypothetical protein
MKRRKSHAKKHTHKRRRHTMGGIKSSGMTVLGIIGGSILGYQVAKIAKSSVPATTSAATTNYIANGIPLALGIFMPKILKSELGKNLGAGMIAAGGVGLVNSVLPSLSGTGGRMKQQNFYANRLVNPAPAVSGYNKRMGAVDLGTNNFLAGIHGVACMEEMG